jgi:hypothetical protein
VIQESQVKKVLVDGGSSINVTFPRMLLALAVALKDFTESDTPFFSIVPTEGEYPLGHIYMPLNFGTPENYRTEFLRFEVARFDCGYNAIIGRPGLAKFMAIRHYSYMILKMPGPQGIITVRADFQGAAECFRGAIQAAITAGPPTAPPAQADTNSEEGLTIPTNEAQAVTSIRPTQETVLVAPSKVRTCYAIRLDFSYTNNIAEYEALLLGLRKLKAMGIRRAVLKTDSQVISGHVDKSCKARDPKLEKYLDTVRRLEASFEGFSVSQVSGTGAASTFGSIF